MKATSFGKLEELYPTSGEVWTQYIERMEQKMMSMTE